MAYQHGRATIKRSGRTLKSKDGATFDKGGWTKTSQTGDQGYYGRSRTFRPSKIECVCAFGPGDSMDDFDFDDETVIFECDSGQTYVVNNAGTVGEKQLTSEGISITIEGPEAQEIL
ncbi:phage tail tube protein [Asticcacaulis sp. YBE204]|uniref:phage tail tube protein n=1 Tax=Asticcacaulis sp. YBE204 TaxID=1282363 RepID=UPI0003C3AEF7|nr:phage tail tube protein [Asticcacaulis sp. YBE204]ESQ78514.1 hypothetical protein AEYBE204_13260 [Asticcacaulis sp. YBE204]